MENQLNSSFFYELWYNIPYMINKIKSNKEGGFIKLIIVIVVALLLMKYFDLTITGILNYFHLTWPEIIAWFQGALNWLKDLFNSVK